MNSSPLRRFSLLVGIVIALAGSAPPVHAEAQIAVQAVQIKTESQPKVYQVFVGTTRAANRVTLRPQMNGRLIERRVGLGQRVNVGDIVAKIYNPGASALATAAEQRWLQAKVHLAQAEKDYLRVNKLYVKGAASKQEHENAYSAHQAAIAAEQAASSQARQAEQQDREQVIRAPFAGVITATPVEPGEVVQMGQGLLQLADPSQVEVEVATSAEIAALVSVGDEVRVSLGEPLLARAVIGKVEELTLFRERGALPSIVVRLQQAHFLPGQTAYVHIPETTSEQVALPLSAVVKVGASKSGVFRINPEHKVELIVVEPKKLIANQVYVKSALKDNDWVVTSGVQRLFEGALVEVVQ